MTNEELNLFKRYLKERGLYKEFINEAQKFPLRRRGNKIIDFLLLYCGPTSGIMNLLGWAETRLGSNFWSSEYVKYQRFFAKATEYKLKNCTGKYYELFQEIKKINQ